MKRIGIILAVLMFVLPAWSAGLDLEKAMKLEIVSRQRLVDFQKFRAALGDSVQKQEPKALVCSMAGIDEAQMAEAPEGALWNSQSEFATGAMGIFNIEPTHGQILKSFPPPPDNPKDMAFDGEFP